MTRPRQKQKWAGCEAPAVRIKMINEEESVIGMMADKVQAIITLPFSDSLSEDLKYIIEKYQEKAYIYLISSHPLNQPTDTTKSSTDFYKFSLKYGVNIDDTLCAKSIFIIDKEGEIIYKDIVDELHDDFDMKILDEALDKTIKFKKTGHTHENWMAV